jgi:hypothetical protein
MRLANKVKGVITVGVTGLALVAGVTLGAAQPASSSASLVRLTKVAGPASPALVEAKLPGPATSAAGGAQAVLASIKGNYASSGVVDWRGADWLGVALNGANGDSVVARSYRWSGAKWDLSGQASLPSSIAGLLGPGANVRAASLTASTTPDFVINETAIDLGPTSESTSAVFSAANGGWHFLPIDFSYKGTLAISALATVQGGRLEAQYAVGESGGTASDLSDSWYVYSHGQMTAAAPLQATPCTGQALGQLTQFSGAPGPDWKGECLDGWALASATGSAQTVIALLNWSSGGWEPVYEGDGGDLANATPQYGIPFAVLTGLEERGGAPDISSELEARGVLVQLALDQPAQCPGVVSVCPSNSGVVTYRGNQWLAVATSTPKGTQVVVYAYGPRGWVKAGPPAVTSFNGPSTVAAAYLTGVATPDFVITGYGADVQFLSDVSDTGGKWHAVPFDYGPGPTVAIDAQGVQGGLVEAEADSCGCAAGAETVQWFKFQPAADMFEPTNPPSATPTCTVAVLTFSGYLPGLKLAKAACLDGWALALGTRHGLAEAELFQQEGTSWQFVTAQEVPTSSASALVKHLLDGASFALPNSLLAQLAAQVGV